MKEKIFLLLLCLLLNQVDTASFDIKMTCVPCTKTCRFSSCFQIVSDGYN